MKTIDLILSSAKALVAAAVAGVAVGATAADDSVITTGEGWQIAAAFLTAFAATWLVPNTQRTKEDATSE